MFDGHATNRLSPRAAVELAARILCRGTTRAELVRSVAQLIILINADMRERARLQREAQERERVGPVARSWRVRPDIDDVLGTAPPDLTKRICGDPAPGRSALDQRQGGIQ